MLNPTRGANYIQVNQSLAEESDEGRILATENVDLEAGPSNFHTEHEVTRLSSKAEGKRHVYWDAGASEMTILHPNIHEEDTIHEEDSSDDEVPQSFKVETTPRSGLTAKFEESSRPTRRQGLSSTSGRRLNPTLPTVIDNSKSPSPTPQAQEHERLLSPGTRSSSLPRQSRTVMRGLDDYEKALWSWVNVYNLDAFLQEVYNYYEGNGVYTIALARGLNLL